VKAEARAGSGPQTDAEKALRDAALSLWLGMGKADPTGDLRHLRAGVMYLERAIGREVIRLRKKGHTWAEIGDALSMTRSAAQQRYAAVVPAVRRARSSAGN
jgi:hypothetical protein